MSATWRNESTGTNVTTAAGSTTWTMSWPPPEPVAYGPDGGVTFDPSVMNEGYPYPYRWQGEWQVVVKTADGLLEFYGFKRRRRPHWFGR